MLALAFKAVLAGADLPAEYLQRGRLVGARHVAVNDVLLFFQNDAAGIAVAVRHGHKNHVAAAPGLVTDLEDFRVFLNRHAHFKPALPR